MKNIFYSVLDVLGNKKFAFIVYIILLLHLGWIMFLVHQQQKEVEIKVIEARTSKVIDILDLIKEIAPIRREYVLSQIVPPAYNIFDKFFISPQPAFKVQISQNSTPLIKEILKENFRLSRPYGISIYIKNNQWLNVYFTSPLYKSWVKLHFLIAADVSLLVGFFIFFWIIRYLAKSFLEFKKAAERLGIDFKATPLSVEGPVVMQETVKALNEMQKRLQAALLGRTRMLAAISHDLRTPLTRLVLRTHSLADENLKQILQADLQEMQSMVNETLAFAKDDALSGQKKYLDIVSLLEVICDESAEIGRNISFQTDISRLPFFGNILSLKRAFNNLIDNAVRYGKHVEVKLFFHRKYFTIIIRDDGPGIKESEIKKVFLPFYSANTFSSDSGLPGTGLGLTIAYEIIQNHGGKIFLKNRKYGGLQVKLRFIIAQPMQPSLA